MTFFSWRTFRLLIIGAILIGNFWLFYWVMPSHGCFHLAGYNTTVGDAQFSLVSFINGKCTNIFSLYDVTMGWPVIKELWPLILLGIMVGYPVGEFVKWRSSLEAIDECMQRKEGILSLALFGREAKISRMVEEANARTAALPQLQKKVKEQRVELYELKTLISEQQQDCETATRKVVILEKELTKARAQLRRLKKKIRSEKIVDEEI